MKKLLGLLTLLAFTGCASSSGIIPTGQDTYMVSRSAGYGSNSTGAVKGAALQEANEYCTNNGKIMQVTNTREIPMSFAHHPEAEIQFMCLKSGDPGLRRGELIPVSPAPASSAK